MNIALRSQSFYPRPSTLPPRAKAPAQMLSEALQSFSQECQFTPRQQETLGYLLSGKTNPEIAKRMRITTRTVKFHVQCLLRKSETSSRGELIRKVLEYLSPSSIETVSTHTPLHSYEPINGNTSAALCMENIR